MEKAKQEFSIYAPQISSDIHVKVTDKAIYYKYGKLDWIDVFNTDRYLYELDQVCLSTPNRDDVMLRIILPHVKGAVKVYDEDESDLSKYGEILRRTGFPCQSYDLSGVFNKK